MYKEFGGAFMFATLFGAGIIGFLQFLKSSIFVVRIYITEVAYSQNL